jgi:Fe-S-cluster containining protein
MKKLEEYVDTFDLFEAELILSNIKKAKEEFDQISIEILKYFECKRCGLCCKQPAGLTDQDIERLYKIDKTIWDKLDERTVDNYLKTPCPYLKGNECAVYEYRPNVCRTHPFTSYYAFLGFGLRQCPLGKEIFKKIEDSNLFKKELERSERLDEHLQGFINEYDEGLPEVSHQMETFFFSLEHLKKFLKYLQKRS